MVAGHSWDAGLALRYALVHPDRVPGVLYISGTGFGQAWRDAYHREADRRRTAQRERRHELKQRPRTADEEQEWRTLSYVSDFGDRRRAMTLAAEFAEVPYPINFECNKALNDEEKAADETELLAACRELDVPVRVVHGMADPGPSWAVHSMVEALPRGELVVLQQVGHLPWLEDPEAFGYATRDFVTTAAADQAGPVPQQETQPYG